MNTAKKLAVIGAGIFLGELAWTMFIGAQVTRITGDSGEERGLDDVGRYLTYAGGVLLIQSVL